MTDLKTALWCDLTTDAERSAWLLLGRGYETGVVAKAMQNDLALAYQLLAQCDAGEICLGCRVCPDAQPESEWQGLTEEEIREGNKESWVTTQAWESAVWWAEAKLKEKNT